MLIKSYIIQVLSTGYVTIKFIKILKGSRAPRACIKNITSINKIREHHFHELKKGEGRKKDLIFANHKLERI